MSEGNIATATVQIDVGGIGGEISGGSSSKSDALLQKILDELKRGHVQTKKDTKDLKSTFSAGNFGKTLGTALKMTGLIAAAGAAAGIGIKVGQMGDAAANYNVPNVGVGYDKVMQDGVEKIAKIDEKSGQIIEILTKEEAERQGILDYSGSIKAELQVASTKYTDQTRGIERINGVLQTSWFDLVALSDEYARQKLLEEDITKISRAVKEANLARLAKLKGKAPSDLSEAPLVKSDFTNANMSTNNGQRDGTVSTWERLASEDKASVPSFNIFQYSQQQEFKDTLNQVARSPDVFDQWAVLPIIMKTGLK